MTGADAAARTLHLEFGSGSQMTLANAAAGTTSLELASSQPPRKRSAK